jgi:rSAM/selenodomain-associated transferase 1
MKTVCIFLKSPRVGEAKSRLARGIGPVRASVIYRALVEHQAAELPVNWRVTIYFAPANAGEEMKTWLTPLLPDKTRFVPQCDGDLGRRLVSALGSEFDRGSERVYLIGGDCPGLTRDYLCAADAALNDDDIVIGPAQDGGYVLFGLKGPHEALFRDIAWSTPVVLNQTLAAARRQALSVRLLRLLVDIDDAATLDQQSKIFSFLREN